jgi:outer membrane protein OmpA-like peptidoglycan-associated protein
MKRLGITTLIFLLLVTFGCGLKSAKKGTIIGASTGAVAGGVTGGVIGKKAGNTAVGAILGAAVGGAAGGYIGKYMDKQATEIESEVEGAKVERVEEGIDIQFDSGILFDVGKADLKPEAMVNLNKFSEILNKYPDTNILIEGHTDSTGSEEFNLKLSKQRAQAVSDYLAGLKVESSRFTIVGYGESQPIATNDTEEGRQANRRVEIAVIANDKLKETAIANTGQ